jgi:hypothetical protein
VRELAQAARHPHVLARGAWAEPDAPAEPVRTALGALPRPALLLVEATNEAEQRVARRVEVRGGDGNLVGEPIDFVGLHEIAHSTGHFGARNGGAGAISRHGGSR